jgi:hypothetical protein
MQKACGILLTSLLARSQPRSHMRCTVVLGTESETGVFRTARDALVPGTVERDPQTCSYLRSNT